MQTLIIFLSYFLRGYMQEDSIKNENFKNAEILKKITIIQNNRLLIVSVTITALVISILISLYLPPIYSSTTRILPPQSEVGLLGMVIGQTGQAGMAGIAKDLLGAGSNIDMYSSILSSEAIKDRIIDRFQLMQRYKRKYRADAYKTLDESVKVKAGRKDGIIIINVREKNPKLAADIANAFVDELDKIIIDLNIHSAGRSKIFLEERLAKANADLSQVEAKLRHFQSKNKTLDISEQSKGTIKGIAELQASLVAEEIKLSSLKRIFTENANEVKSQKLIVGNIKQQIQKLENDNVSNGTFPSIGSAPAIAQEYIRIMRDFKTQEALVEMLTKQHEFAKLYEANYVPTIRVLQKAIPSDKKIKPSRRKIVLVSVFLSFLASIAFILAREKYRTLSPFNKRILSTFQDLFKFTRDNT